MPSQNHPAGPLLDALTLAQPAQANLHWLSIGSMLADLAFETDAAGVFTSFGPGNTLGFPVADLLGQNLAALLALRPGDDMEPTSLATVFATLATQNVTWRGTGVLERGDLSQAVYQIVLAPKISPDGSRDGTYGLLINLHPAESSVFTSDEAGARAALDPQTGLWSAASFIDEAARRFDRLDVEGLPGTLLLLGFSRTPTVGQKVVAAKLASELREIIRPTDLLGRLNATTFALWCDGMDNLTGAERAARFCERLPAALPSNQCISIGMVTRWPGSADEPETLISRATAALNQAYNASHEAALAGDAGPVSLGTWRVWNSKL